MGRADVRRHKNVLVVAFAGILLLGVLSSGPEKRSAVYAQAGSAESDGADARSTPARKRSSSQASAAVSFSVLHRKRMASDTLDRKLLGGPFAAEVKDASAARYVGSFEGSDYYLVPARRRRLCVVDRDNLNGTTGGNCADRPRPPIGYWLGSLTPDGNRKVVTIIPDGYTKVMISGGQPLKRSSIKNNTLYLLLRATRQTTVVLSGPGGQPITFVFPSLGRRGSGKAGIVRQ